MHIPGHDTRKCVDRLGDEAARLEALREAAIERIATNDAQALETVSDAIHNDEISLDRVVMLLIQLGRAANALDRLAGFDSTSNLPPSLLGPFRAALKAADEAHQITTRAYRRAANDEVQL